jgi:Tol biopolymer transport system component
MAGMAMIAVFAITAGAAHASSPGANGRVAFDRADGYLYSIRANGTGLRRIGMGYAPDYSPNGRRIAFVSPDGNIWTMRSDGSNRKRLTATPVAVEWDPSWSPDGTRVAFGSERNGGGIFTVRAAYPYGTVRQLVDTPAGDEFTGLSDESPDWATNGVIYFTRHSFVDEGSCSDGADIMVVNPSTRVVREWDRGALGVSAEQPDTAPDSSAVVYHQWEWLGCDFRDRIAMADTGGSTVRGVTPWAFDQAFSRDPAFSPDGKHIAFARDDGYVYTVGVTGQGLRRLAAGSDPTWQPLQ